jgi:nitroreductase
MREIFERRSIRKYTDAVVPDELIEKLLMAAMAAPSAGNQQPWEFVVIRDRKVMEGIIEFHPYAQMLDEAPLAISVCADLNRETHKGYWMIDCAAATENILLEAQHLGLGAVWLGIYPRTERVAGLKALLNLPENVMPLCVISIGYPAEKKNPSNRFDSSRIHRDRW